MLDVNEIKNQIKYLFHDSTDIVFHEFFSVEKRAILIYIDGMTDKMEVNQCVLEPLTKTTTPYSADVAGIISVISSGIAPYGETDINKCAAAIAGGDAVLVLESGTEPIVFKVKKLVERSVAEPPTSAVIKGPREGFVEGIKTNLALLRKRLQTPDLVFDTLVIGRRTQTSVTIAYLSGVAPADIVSAVQKRLRAIDIDGIIDSSYITRFLEARPYSIFKQIGSTEKPDIAVAKLLEGRVAVIVDGSPIVLTLPFMLIEDFQSSDDYFRRPARASLLRFFRIIALFFALFLPALLVALEQYQFQMLPLKLLTTILTAVKGIPFTPLVEMLIALTLFEILNEASVRMPRYVGMAMSVVGAIVLGDTAVQAGVLSSVAVLVTALSAIGLYAIPDEVGTFSLLRFILVIAAGCLGLYGLVLVGLVTCAYLVNLETYGVPYLAPFAPLVAHDLEDSVIKLGLKEQKFRPKVLRSPNKRRQSD